MIGRVIGRYRVVSLLGRGGIATVWKADDPVLGRPIALKILDERLATSSKARRRFLHEAQATAALDHPGIIAVHEYGESDGLAFIALAHVDGETLSERAARRLLAFDEAVRIVAAAADALDHAHERGVIHRDVTGRNIMVARDGRVVVLDFGLALAAWESRVTTTAVAMGTASYMAPEVIQARPADVRSDVYGLGVVLYEAVTGTYPFTGEQAQAVYYAATHLEPTPPSVRRPELPPELERVVLTAIRRDPEARFQTAAEFAGAVRRADLGSGRRVDPTGTGVDAAGPGSDPRTEASTVADVVRDAGPVYLAVLPFEAIECSPEPPGEGVELAHRLTASLTAALGNAPRIRVVPPSREAVPADPREAAATLGANLLLRGSVRQTGSRVDASFALIDPRRAAPLAADQVEGSALQPFDVEDRVVGSVTGALELAVSGGAPRTVPRSDPAAADHYRQALGYLKRYDNEAMVDAAIVLFERLIASDVSAALYHAGLARACIRKQTLTQERMWESRAASACARAQELDPQAPETLLAAAELENATERHERALAHFQRVLELRPGWFDALLGIARVHHDAGRYAVAEAACQAAIAAEPDDWRGHSLLGSIHFRWGHFESALEPWRRVTQITPDNIRGHRNLGNALYRLDRLEEAVRAYENSIAILPNADAYNNLGTALYHLGRSDECITALRHAAELAPTNPLRWGNLGNACHWSPGHELEAARALDRAILLMRERLARSPSDAEGWTGLAGWLANRGALDDARAAIRRALELAPDDIGVMVGAGHVYFQLGERAECLRQLARARSAGYGPGELLRSRELAPLRGDPEFLRLVEQPSPTGSDDDGIRRAGAR